VATPPPQGVQPLDHTADVGLEVEASSLEELLVRAGQGALWLALGSTGGANAAGERPHGDRSGLEGRGVGETRTLSLEADDREGLLRSWTRELLYWAEVEDFVAYRVLSLEVEGGGDVGPDKLTVRARLQGGPSLSQPIREIKGVTWHGLVVEERPEGWFARVIFDV
jgi:SHS2 domain-containing protein